MAEPDLLLEARTLVLDYINDYPENLKHLEDIDPALLHEVEVLDVRPHLGGWKVTLTTSFPNGYLYQVIIDGYSFAKTLVTYKQQDMVTYPEEEEGHNDRK